MAPSEAQLLIEKAGKVCWVAGADLTVWLRMNRRLADDPSLGNPADFFEFISRTTFDSLAIRLRGLLKDDSESGTVSIASVIGAVARGQLHLTRQRAVFDAAPPGAYPQVIEAVNDRFSELAKSGSVSEFPVAVAKLDLERCGRIVDPIRRFANDWVAHIKVAPQSSPPWLYHYMRAWSFSRRMIYKYEFLLRGSHLAFDPDGWLGLDWRRSFNKAWFPERTRGPLGTCQ